MFCCVDVSYRSSEDEDNTLYCRVIRRIYSDSSTNLDHPSVAKHSSRPAFYDVEYTRVWSAEIGTVDKLCLSLSTQPLYLTGTMKNLTETGVLPGFNVVFHFFKMLVVNSAIRGHLSLLKFGTYSNFCSNLVFPPTSAPYSLPVVELEYGYMQCLCQGRTIIYTQRYNI